MKYPGNRSRHSSQLYSFNDIFGKEYKKQIKLRLKELIGDEPIGKQVRKAIKEAETVDAGVS